MAIYTSGTRPGQFRLPLWAHDYINERAAQYGKTKTEVVLEALECLRQRDVYELMAEGYEARAADGRQLADTGLQAAEESWPEW
jgi:hypothetical protein